MDIYIDGLGLAEYFNQLRQKIRKENDPDNNSIFNVNPKVWNLNQTFVKQSIIAFFGHRKAIDLTIDEKDIDYVCDRNTEKDIVYNAIAEFIPLSENTKDFKNDFNDWLKDVRIEISYSEDEITSNGFKRESSISLLAYTPNHNQCSIIAKNRIIETLRSIFFVYEDSPNRVIFTQDMKGWGILKNTMKSEKDIIIVDPYFFQSEQNESDFGTNEKAFLDALCDNQDEKNIVIFYKNCVCSEWLEGFSCDFKKKRANCKLTFIGVTNKHALHDRLIVSNYRLIFSGHSFPLYFKEGEFSANGSIGLTVNSIVEKNTEKVMISTLSYLQKSILDEVKNYYVYGDCETNLLDIKQKKVEPQTTILDFYPYGTEVVVQQDENNILHYGTNVVFKNSKVLSKGKRVRLCNIEKNKFSYNNRVYKWKAYAFVLPDKKIEET